MSNPFLGELRIFGFNFPPKGWSFCNGQLLSINQNQALFSLLGTTYGGNGTTTFGLPNLQGRVPVHHGQGLNQGDTGGEVNHTLLINEMPTHTHQPMGTTSAPSSGSVANNVWCQNSASTYAASPNVAMNPQSIVAAGGNQPHNNMSPYLTLSFCIALQGIFPSRN